MSEFVLHGRNVLQPEAEAIRARIISKTAILNGCWIFGGAKNEKGYGVLVLWGRKGKIATTHRLMYMIERGTVSSGLMVCHTCDTPACVNPAHLYVGTALDNNRDREARGRRNVKGERHHNAKLSDDAVKAIIRGGKNDAEFGREFGVDRALVRRVRLGKAWMHIYRHE